jgi:ArsR family transcriptional regulator, virulence genes transcriptional regulator
LGAGTRSPALTLCVRCWRNTGTFQFFPLRKESCFRNCEFVQAIKQRLFELHAELCAMMAHPKRLAILESLHDGERSVSAISEEVGASITTVSQHLRLLRDKNVVETRKDAQTVYYRLRDPRMIQACNLIREVLLDGIKAQGDFAASNLESLEAAEDATPPQWLQNP